MIINRQRVYDLHQMLDIHFDKLLQDLNLSKNLLNGVTIFRRLAWTLTFFICLTCGIYVLTPLIFTMYQHLHHIHPIKYILVYPGIYPWDIQPNGFLYKLHYLCESIPNIALICVTAGVDSLFTLHIFQMIGRLREMSFRIIHTNPENYLLTVRECVEEHEILIKCCDLLQKVYGPMILWIMVTNAVILCSITFQFTQVHYFKL
uniref:Olfactory receptor 102 n=1 Tax=Aulacocentrum confusum TaxID=2767324 RepID=A0A7G8Z9C1_9HYME|nr:olfactory receptor 102 [Aulacocentrum confusum]